MNADSILGMVEENNQARRERMGRILDKWAPKLIRRAAFRVKHGGICRAEVMTLPYFFSLTQRHEEAGIDGKWIEAQMNIRLEALGSPLRATYFSMMYLLWDGVEVKVPAPPPPPPPKKKRGIRKKPRQARA